MSETQSSANPNLSPCPDCGNLCSLAATSCPKCGRPFKIDEVKTPPKDSKVPCMACGFLIPKTASVCVRCGQRVGDAIQELPPLTAKGTRATTTRNRASGIVAIGILSLSAIGVLWWTGVLGKWLQSNEAGNRNKQAAINLLPPETASATRGALAALRKIDAATQVKPTYMQYNQLVIDAKAEVNQAASLLLDGELKEELNAAMDAYADASIAWSATLNDRVLSGENEPGKTLSKKYNLGLGEGKDASYKAYVTELDEQLQRYKNPNYESEPRKHNLNTIWQTARTHLNRASSLLSP